jgi:hypothetical protein
MAKTDIKKKIKEMEAAIRKEQPAQAVDTQAAAAQNDKISFDQWWMILCSKKIVRSYLKEILIVDFMARGLTKNETEQTYNDTLKLFGITI